MHREASTVSLAVRESTGAGRKWLPSSGGLRSFFFAFSRGLLLGLRGWRHPFVPFFCLRAVQRSFIALRTQHSLLAFNVLIDQVAQVDRRRPLVARLAL